MALASLAAALVVALSAPTHTPRADAKWFYTVRATAGGKPVAGRVTVEIVDPFGGVHPAQYGTTSRDIVNRPFSGRFRDFVEWPSESAGLKLIFRVTVRAAGAKRVVTYWVRAR
jgi:hypothetical protein